MSQYDMNANVLFIGHSLVGPTMPGMVDAAAESRGGTGAVDAQVINGAPLIWQWQHGADAQGVNAREVLPSGNYDVLVMTEGLPLLNHVTWSDTNTYVRNYYDLAVSNNPDARVYVYETWHSLNSGTGIAVPHDNEDHIPWRDRLDTELARWEGIVDGVNADLEPGQPEVMLIPVGQAMGMLHDRIEAGLVPGLNSINQLFSDDIHTNDLGSYFVTMVQYATIYGDDPRNLPIELAGVSGVPTEAMADALQEIAWNAVTTYDGSGVTADGGGVTPPPPADLDPEANEDSATTDEGDAVMIDVLANDVDRDGDGMSIFAVGDAANGTVGIEAGQIVYTPDADFSGSDTFSYTVTDANGDTDTAMVSVTVNSAPTTPEPPAPPSEPTTPALSGDAVLNPSVAIGLAGVNDWSVQQPFLDVMKTGREWIGHIEGQWGGWSFDQLEAGGYLDENGWPTELPDGVGAISSLILTDLPAETADYTAGRYRVTYEGEGELVISGGGASNVVYGDGEIWFDFTPRPGPVLVTIESTDPNGTGNNIRNVSVVQEDHIEAYENGEIFNPLWLEQIGDFRSLRYMDWMETNDSEQSEWADRPSVNDFSWGVEGVPLEIMVELANQVGADPWFNMPHLATDEYMREFAEYVEANLDPDLRAYVEFSNEVWNWQFEQAIWAEEQGRERWGTDLSWTQYATLRATEMAQIWDSVFGEQADARLDLVLGLQAGWMGLEQDMLNGTLWRSENPDNPAPYTFFDSYAITGYFSAGLGHDEKAGVVLGWIDESEARAVSAANNLGLSGTARDTYIEEHRYDYATELAIQELRDGSVTGDTENSLAHIINTVFAYHAGVAEEYGLDLVMYEGGSHVVGVGSWVGNQELTDFFTYLNYTDEMGELYEILLEGWRDAGGTMFNAFVDVYTPNQYGSWGHLRTLTDESVRWDQILDFNINNPAWWEEDRATGAFVGTAEEVTGVELNGTNGNDEIDGGAGNDMLVGGGGFDTMRGDVGDDTLRGDNGADSLFGDDGNDRIEGGQGFDQLFGGNGDDTIMAGETADRAYGGDGNDVIFGGTNVGLSVDGLWGEAGDDTIAGQGGFDLLDGGDGNDLLDGGDQADNVYGRDGEDTLIGGQGLDRLFGGNGNDIAYGGTGNDGLFGDFGDDTLFGETGNDNFFGGSGDDLIFGGADNDTINGGSGFDTIDGGSGDDEMFGRFNADTFVFVDGHGNDTVGDFDSQNDFEQIDFSGLSTINSLADLNLGSATSGAATQVGQDVVIDTGGGNSIVLTGVNLSDLDAADFIF